MPGLNLTIDDESPLITYRPDGAWIRRNSSTDNAVAGQFYGGTHTMTQEANATISFTFEGITVTVYGSKGPNHGDYIMKLDGSTYHASGQGPTQYQTPIFSTDLTLLAPGTHTLTVLNQNASILDIDYITWVSKVNQDKNGDVVRLVVDDVDAAFHYQAGTYLWSATPSNSSTDFFKGTGHRSSKFGSADNFTFTGDAVALFGTIGPQNSPYTVKLDDQAPKLYAATTSTYAPQTLLYYGSNILGTGDHWLHIVNQGGGLLEVDYAEVYTIPLFSNTTSNSSQTPDATGAKHNGSRISTGSIVGATAGGVLAVVLVLLLGFCLILRLKKRARAFEQGRSAVKFQDTYDTPPSHDVSENMTVVSPFRLSGLSRSTLGSPHSPISEGKRKSSVPQDAHHTPTPWPNVSVERPSTLVGEDGTNVASQRERRTPRKSGHNKPTRIDMGASIPTQTAKHGQEAKLTMEHFGTPTHRNSEVRESIANYPHRHSDVVSERRSRTTTVAGFEDDASAVPEPDDGQSLPGRHSAKSPSTLLDI